MLRGIWIDRKATFVKFARIEVFFAASHCWKLDVGDSKGAGITGSDGERPA